MTPVILRLVLWTAGWLMANGFASAQTAPTPHWIWHPTTTDNQWVHFRKEFEVTAPIVSAKLVATCDNQMTLSVDGKMLLQGNDWQLPLLVDLTSTLTTKKTPQGIGKHLIAVRAKNENGPAGLLVRLTLEFADKRTTTIVSDASWTCALFRPAQGSPAAEGNQLQFTPVKVIAPLGAAPWSALTAAQLDKAGQLREPTATPVEKLKVAKDFRVELLYSVPKEVQGSWVNMCVDPKGRLIVSDQYGPLYRVTPPPFGGKAEDTKVEKLPLDIGEAQGLLWAFDSLYVMVNRGSKYESGLYRVRDTNGDGELDEVKLLRKLNGGAEHGPHAVLLSPDGKSLTVVCGNATKLTTFASTRVPTHWGEDHLLPRMPDGRGFMAGVLGPGGAVYKVDPEGQNWELLCAGFRNQYDAAYNRAGDLFTYDADMEWDFNTPWYRPTRVCLVASGGEFGWRNGAGKWPAYYPDSLPAIVDIGPGSPTGVTFGYGAKFPAKYQEALYLCDWSYGKLYAAHLVDDGAAYRAAQVEEFITGTPLPLTDVVINPHDGAMYFTIGGRRTKSGLYRVTYVGKESTAPAPAQAPKNPLRTLRHKLESYHGKTDPAIVDAVWPSLGHADRYIRYAARIALEFQPPKTWSARALAETNVAAQLTALLGLVRTSADDPQHHPKDAKPIDPKLKADILQALAKIDFAKLTTEQQLEMTRIYQILFVRMGPPDDAQREALIAKLDAVYPAKHRFVDGELSQILVYLQAPHAATKTMKLLLDAPTQEEQIEYGRSLRMLKFGWTPELREQYFRWLVRAAGYPGGMSFSGFIDNIKRDAIATLSDAEKLALKPILEAKPTSGTVVHTVARPFVKKWTMEELAPLLDTKLVHRDFERGRAMFAAANCFACHRFDNQGGAQGPDLTGAAGRFSPRDLLESILEPSKSISDQYAAVNIETDDGKLITGRIINLNGDSIIVNTDMLNPSATVTIDRRRIETMELSKVSMMPEGLLNTLHQEEILDLMAYLLSRGDRKSPMFKK